MWQKGHHLIGETLHKLSDNVNKVNKDFSKKKGLFQLPSLEKLMPTNPENPLMKLKETLFPAKSENTVVTLTEKPKQELESTSYNLESTPFSDHFAEKLALQSWKQMQENEMNEEKNDDGWNIWESKDREVAYEPNESIDQSWSPWRKESKEPVESEAVYEYNDPSWIFNINKNSDFETYNEEEYPFLFE